MWYYQGLLLGIFALILGLLQVIQGAWTYARLSLLTGVYTIEDAFEMLFGRKWQTAFNLFQFFSNLLYGIGCIYVSATCL